MSKPLRQSTPSTPRQLLAATLTLLVAGCSVGPDYVRPNAPMTAAFKEAGGQASTNAGEWKTAHPSDEVLRGAWWEIYGDRDLSALERQVTAANQNLVAAEARFRQARALVAAARASWFPTVSIGVSASRARVSENLGGGRGLSGSTTNDFAMPLTVAWEADVWGKIRRQVESSEASAQATAADLAGTQLSLQAELAADYFQLRAIDAERKLLEDTALTYERFLDLTQSRHAEGVASGADVAQAETQLEGTRAQAIDLGVQRSQLEHAIAVLIGKPPAAFTLPATHLAANPPTIPISVPSAMLERRPDVGAAERRMAAANADIGVAIAAYYPTVTLGASSGLESSDISNWFAWPSRFWSVGPAINETIYDGGRRAAQTEQARAAYDETVAAYRQTVLNSFQEVEDQLAALRILASEGEVQARAVDAARRSVDLTKDQYQAGIASYLNVVVVNAAALQDERDAVNIDGRRLVASVLLIQGLGGGWNAHDLPRV